MHYGGARGPFCWCRRRNPHRTGRPSPVQDPSAETWLTRPQPPGTEQLAHLHEPNHSPDFWRLVSRGLPDYETRRDTLEAWGAGVWLPENPLQ
ncbi:hypothetical protein BOG92_022815 [Streptomyces sp. WAC00263]|nr:hypothetical protein BOG92_022815 [Streptomyces sp. WAC00263]